MRREPTFDLLIPAEIAMLPTEKAAAAMKVTLSDIKEWERLGGVCPRCNRHGLLNMYKLRRRYADRNLVEIERFLHCTGCENRTGNLFVVSKIPRD